MEITEGVDEVAGLVATDLCDHDGEERVGSDVEGNSKEEIGATLVELAAQTGALGFRIVDVELKKKMAGWECHLIDFSYVPSRDEMATGGGFVFEVINEAGDLVDGVARTGGPGAPLLAINGAEVAVFIGPFIPDANLVLLEVGDVGFAFQEPEEFVNDRPEVKFFSGEAREAFTEIVACLSAKNAECPGSSTVASLLAIVKDIRKEIEVSLHREDLSGHKR